MNKFDTSTLKSGDYFKWEWDSKPGEKKHTFVCVWNGPSFISIDKVGDTHPGFCVDDINRIGKAQFIGVTEAYLMLQSFYDEFCEKTKDDKGLQTLLNIRTKSDLDRRIQIVHGQEPSEQTYYDLANLKLLPSKHFVLVKPNVREARYDPIMAIIAPEFDMPEELISRLAGFYFRNDKALNEVRDYRAIAVPVSNEVYRTEIEPCRSVHKLENIVFKSL